jgi:hypothetical protein
MNVSMLCYFHECSWWSVSTVVRMDWLFVLIRHDDSVFFWLSSFLCCLCIIVFYVSFMVIIVPRLVHFGFVLMFSSTASYCRS